jgi:ABC-type nitrate/sulfonate/bicarbonate transport system substrate-binding protein
MTDLTSRRAGPAHRFRILFAVAFGLLALTLAACGDSDSGGSTTSGDSAATTSSTAADTGGFQPGEPEPGTDIPAATVKFGMRPYADNSFEYVGIKNGYYKDNGISIAPPPYGVKNSDNAIAQMLNGTVDIESMYAPGLIPTFKTDQSLKQIMFTDYFNGWALLAPGKMNLTPVSEYIKQGVPFEEAMKKALEPMKGKELVVAPLLDAREFVKQSFNLAGLPQPKLKVMDDPKSLIAARSGQIDFAVPTGAPTTLQFEREGWTPLVTPYDIIDNAKGASAEKVAGLAGAVGLASNEGYINDNPNTILRFVSATYRTIDALKNDPSKADEYAPYLNSITGLKLTGDDIKQLFEKYDPLTDFDFGKTYCQDKDALLYYENAYKGIIASYEEQGAIPKGKVQPGDVIWACGVWETLRDYEKKTDALFEQAKSADLAADKQALLDKAKTYYEQFNFLDSYRLATAAVG